MSTKVGDMASSLPQIPCSEEAMGRICCIWYNGAKPQEKIGKEGKSVGYLLPNVYICPPGNA